LTESKWRLRARPIIQRVLRETDGQTEKEIRAALRAAYPFGLRENHPYTIWLDEVKRQRRTLRMPETNPAPPDDGWLPLFAKGER
jgi:hypothetical protein